MKRAPLIAVWSGRAGAGRTTVANLIRAANPIYRLASFAAPADYMLNALLQVAEVPYDVLYRSLYVERDLALPIPGSPSSRSLREQLMESLSRECPDFWARLLERRLDESEQPTVVDDLTAPWELDMVRARGGKVIAVSRPGLDGAPMASGLALDSDPNSFRIDNDGSIGELENKVARVLARLEDEVRP